MSTLVITLPLGSPQAPADYSYTLTVDGHNATQQASASAALLPATLERVFSTGGAAYA